MFYVDQQETALAPAAKRCNHKNLPLQKCNMLLVRKLSFKKKVTPNVRLGGDKEEPEFVLEQHLPFPEPKGILKLQPPQASIGTKRRWSGESAHAHDLSSFHSMSKICQEYKGRSPVVDGLLQALCHLEMVIVKSMSGSRRSLRFASYEPSVVAPPDFYRASTIDDVDRLVRGLLCVKIQESYVKREPSTRKVCFDISQEIVERSPNPAGRHLAQLLRRISEDAPMRGVYDQEILTRVSSLVRFLLKVVLNEGCGYSHFVRVVNARRACVEEEEDAIAGIASVFHRALCVLASTDSENMDPHDYVEFRSAKNFAVTILDAMPALVEASALRGDCWDRIQSLLREAVCTMHSGLEEFQLLLDIPTTKMRLCEQEKALDLQILGPGSKSRHQRKGSLRARRAAETTLYSEPGSFPTIAYAPNGLCPQRLEHDV